jgi:hypothetical protein
MTASAADARHGSLKPLVLLWHREIDDVSFAITAQHEQLLS